MDTSPNLESKGLWGGLVLLGDDSVANYETEFEADGGIYSKPTNINVIEGFPAPDSNTNDFDNNGLNDLVTYGSTDPPNTSHSAGSLQWVSISHAGIDLGNGNTMSGLTLAGVGNETSLLGIEVLSSGGDGIQLLGGSVNMRGAFVGYQDGDALSINEGYDGHIQYFASLQSKSTGTPTDVGLGGEWAGNNGGSAMDIRSTPIIANFTLIGDNGGSDHAIKFDDYFGGYAVNGVITNFTDLIATTDEYASDSWNLGRNFFGVYHDVAEDRANSNEAALASSMTSLPNLGLGVIDLQNNRVNPVPTATSPLLRANGAIVWDLPSYGYDFFWSTDHAGAFPLGYNWLKGWTVADFVHGIFE